MYAHPAMAISTPLSNHHNIIAFSTISRGSCCPVLPILSALGSQQGSRWRRRLILPTAPPSRRLSCHGGSTGGAPSLLLGFRVVALFNSPGSDRSATDSLPRDVRERALKAVDELGGRVTVGDVASRSGLKVSQVQTALQALASDSGGFLEVSEEGDVLYVFPRDYKSNLLSKSFKYKIEPLANKFKAAADYLIRVSFGTTLLASIAIVYSTIFVILSSARSEDNNRNNRGGYSTNQRMYGSGPMMVINPYDLLWYWDPYYYRRTRVKRGGMNFFESVFSFVFGDGDPNEGSDEQRWKVIGEYIRSKGGVVCSEEIAPFLDVPPMSESKGDESFMLPVLLKFDGEPEVDDKGNILYRFPMLQRTASDRFEKRVMTFEMPQFFKEKSWNFSDAGKMQLFLVIALGAANLVGVLVLSSLLKDASLVGRFGGSGLVPFVSRILPLLQVYTASFFAIPAVRWFLIQRRNSEISSRNGARVEWAQALEWSDVSLRKKLRSAAEKAKQVVIRPDQIIYSTEKDLAEQNYDAWEWEKKLKEKEIN